MSDSLSQFPAIIQAINGPTGLIALLALLIFGIAVLMFGKEGTKVKLFIFVSLLLITVFAVVASVSFEQEKQWAEQTETNQPETTLPDTTPEPIVNTGFPTGTVIQQCGCWGYVDFGATDVAPSCASGYAEAVGCPMFCPAGGSQWMIKCL